MTMNDMEILSWEVHFWVTQGYPNATSMLLIDFVIEMKYFAGKDQELHNGLHESHLDSRST